MSRSKKVISFSLWGSQPVYIVGAVQNAELAPQVFPGWICRFYASRDVPVAALDRLTAFDHVEVLKVDAPGSWQGLFWRFYALDDDDVEVVIFRDTDSRLNARDKAAIDEWLASGKSYHIIRDSPLQHAAINGGLWGARAKIPGGLQRHTDLFLSQEDNPHARGYSSDQHFLGEVIYPIIAPDALVHDEYFEGRPFPTSNDDGQFVGEKVDANGVPDPIGREFIRQCRAKPSNSLAVYYHRYASLLQKSPGRLNEAVGYFQRAIGLDERLIPAYINLGNLLHRAGRSEEAVTVYRKALARDPNSVEGHANLGAIHLNKGEMKRARRFIERTLELRPDYVPALQNLVYLREVEQDHLGAMEPLRRLLEQKPDSVEYLQRLAALASRGEDWQTAFDTYVRLREIDPQSLPLFSLWMGARLRLCNWEDYDALIAELVDRNRVNLAAGGNGSTSLMDLNAMPVPLELHTDISRALAASVQRNVAAGPPIVRRARIGKGEGELRIGYISPDLRNHAVGRLVHPLFKNHTRPEFKVYCYSLVRTGDKIQKAIRAGCDVYRDLFDVESGRAAQQIWDDGVDVLIDLAGYTTHARPDILAYRPAAVQCMLMGFPDTMGADFYDCVLADERLIPESLVPYYVEKIHYLPHAFFGTPMEIPRGRYERSDFGLAEDEFVFLCNANNAHHKISPAVYDAWMEILAAVDSGVLWISAGPEAMQENLRTRAADRGIDPGRVRFAPHLPWTGYLQRLRLADMALDTYYYNGGSSSIATVSAGVPLLTCAGETNASRMGASICAAAGLDSMITSDLNAYSDRAIALATEGAEELEGIRSSLENPRALPLFDLRQIAKDMETAARQLTGRT